MTLFWHETGPKIEYVNGALHIHDLNPEIRTKWRMSRSEMLRLGWQCMIAAWKGLS